MIRVVTTGLATAVVAVLTACGRDEKPTQVIIQQPPAPGATVVTPPPPRDPVVVVPR